MNDDGPAAPTPLPDRTGSRPATGPDDPERAEALAEIGPSPVPPVLPRNDWRRILLRVACSLAFLGLLFWRMPDVSIGDLFPRPTAATFAWVAVAIGVHVGAYALQTVRWAQVSDTLGIHLPFRRLFSHLLAGEFVSNALPTSFGGDVVRVMRQGKDVGDYADAFASTSLERLSGWLVLPVLSAVGLLLDPALRSLGAATTVAVLVDVVTVVALLAILWVAGHERGAGRLVGRPGWRRYLGAVHLGIVAFRHRPGRIVRVLVAGIGFQFLQCVSVWACARALDIPQVTLLAAMAFFPPTAVVQNLPIALGGLGVREAAFVLFFGALGVPDARAIGLGLLVYLVFVAASLAGAPSFAVGGRPAGAPSRTSA
jgi:glycosyltransferase 2 family protein